MAVASYSLQTIQDRIHILVENDPNTPSVTDDEWILRYQLIRQAVNNWESEDVFWDELFGVYTHPTSVTVGVKVYSIVLTLPDFNSPGSYIKFTDPVSGAYQYLEVVKPEDMTERRDDAKVVYFTGDTGNGYTLNLGWIPAVGDSYIGNTISFMYYKSGSSPASPADLAWAPQMSNPDYITFWVTAQKHLMDGNTNQFNVFSGMAQDNLDKMKIFNETKPINSDMRPADVDLIRNNSFFGG